MFGEQSESGMELLNIMKKGNVMKRGSGGVML